MQATNYLTRFALITAALLSTESALANAFKCTSKDGKVTYSDEPCPKGTAGTQIETHGTVIDNSSVRREAQRMAREERARSVATTASPKGQPFVLTEAEEVQIRNYSITLANNTAYPEAREVADREIRRLRNGENRRFSGAEAEERSVFIRTAMVAIDKRARREAINALMAFDSRR